MERPESCPNCGESNYQLNPPEDCSRMCHIGTLKPKYGGWQFYHD